MSSECQQCGAKSQLFLCQRHIDDMSRMLRDLPWWVDRLAEAAAGQVRHNTGRSSGRRDISGDDEVLAPCKCKHPEHADREVCGIAVPTVIAVVLNEPDEDGNTTRTERGPDEACDCREYIPAIGQVKMRDAFLSVGRVNAKASRMLDTVTNTLTTIVRDLCESRGIEVPDLGQGGIGLCHRISALLRKNVSAIASGEAAGQTFIDIRDLVGDEHHDGKIGRIVNRPVPMRWLGHCPTWIESKRAVCGNDLRCPQGAVEVYCRKCRQTHNPDRLQLLMMGDLERQPLTWDRLLKANKTVPDEYRVSERTLQSWRQKGPNGEPPKLRARYQRPDKSWGNSPLTAEDVEVFLWSDVRKLREAKPQKAVTGAAARKKVS